MIDSQQRHDRAGLSQNGHADRLPPHDMPSEQGVLGCILLSPESCVTQYRERFGAKTDAFYDLRHQCIMQSILAMDDAFEAVDMITLQQRLKNSGLLDEVGGLAYLTALPDTVPSAANLSYYLDIVEEKYDLRRLIQTCTSIVNRVYDHTGDVKTLMDHSEYDLRKVFDRKARSLDDSMSWQDLMDFDTSKDPNCVIGFKDGKTTRFLCKGHAAWIIAPSGAGKSSLHMRLARDMASGKDFFGVKGRGPLRVLVVQAENDQGDMAEMAQGMSLESDQFDPHSTTDKLLNSNIVVRTVVGVIGQHFCRWLRKAILDHKAELVLVDPLLSFAGIDVSRQSDVSMFCRVWLDPVLRETGAVLISVHHTGKPSKEQKPGHEPSIYELMYDGLGSSELVNWARAVMLLQHASDNDFRLVFAKRGKRAWATHPDGTPAQTIWIRQSATSINWEQISPPEEPDPAESRPSGRPNKINEICSMNLFTFCNGCTAEGETLNAIAKRLEKCLAAMHFDASLPTCKRVVPELVSRQKLQKGEDGLYRVGENA